MYFMINLKPFKENGLFLIRSEYKVFEEHDICRISRVQYKVKVQIPNLHCRVRNFLVYLLRYMVFQIDHDYPGTFPGDY